MLNRTAPLLLILGLLAASGCGGSSAQAPSGSSPSGGGGAAQEGGSALAADARSAATGDIPDTQLENAARYARDRITLEIRAADADVVFEIRDDGPGVDPSSLERIFEPGFRGIEAHADEHHGAGLGLALARRLARAAGGGVEVRASSTGASFAVRLPAG
jgi:nitrogen-specific signal transduction histidine kinase